MSSPTTFFRATVNEDGSATLLARVCARTATGSDSPIATEGKLTKQADLSSVTYNLFDLSASTPTTATVTRTLTIADVVYDTLQTGGIWGLLINGGNFLYDVPATDIPTGNHLYYAELKFTYTGGAIAFGRFELPTIGVLGS